jgi:hypothetical protein
MVGSRLLLISDCRVHCSHIINMNTVYVIYFSISWKQNLCDWNFLGSPRAESEIDSQEILLWNLCGGSRTQRRQRASLCLQSSELGPPAPPPHSQASVPPPPLDPPPPGGGTHLRERGVPVRTKGQTLCYSRYICYFVLRQMLAQRSVRRRSHWSLQLRQGGDHKEMSSFSADQ